MSTTKTTQDRQKIEIKKIENRNSRVITFSKRRAGLFKKASKLCILSGAEVAIIVKSPGKRMFAFGHPNVDAVISRYLAGNASCACAASPPATTGTCPSVDDFNQRYAQVSKELEAEKRRRAMIEESKKAADGGGGFWWDEAVDHLGLMELEHYAAALEELKKNVAMRADELMLSKAFSLPSPIFGVDTNALMNPGGLADSFINQGCDCGISAIVPLVLGWAESCGRAWRRWWA